jgi:putative peptide zinc metalloprotease protein
VGRGSEQSYLIKDPLAGQSYEFAPWQFFILEVLPGCEEFSKLASVFQDRFGHGLTDGEVEELFSSVAEKNLFGLSATSHPMLAEFSKKRSLQLERASSGQKGCSGNSKDGGTLSAPEGANSSPRPASSEESRATSGASPPNPLDFEDSLSEKGWKLFNPTGLIKSIQPFLLPLRHTIYLLPVLIIAAICVCARYAVDIEESLIVLRDGASLVEHVLFSMFTVNILVTLAISIVAYSFRATVHGFCINFYLGIIPRFMARIGHMKQLSRRERIWLHATPLMLRMTLFSVGILIWFNNRSVDGFLPKFGLALAAAAAISFILTVNPLLKSNGYYLVAAFLNEPKLREKAYRALLNKIRGNIYQKADSGVLIAYSLASTFFIIIFIGVFLLLLGRVFKFHLGSPGILVLTAVGAWILIRMVNKFKEIDQIYERSMQFEKWRNRVLPKVESEAVDKKSGSSTISYIKRAGALAILLVMFVPYVYEPGGTYVILPNQKQEITSEISGLIHEIYFDGGEVLEKGAPIGRLSHDDYSAQVKIYAAKIKEQEQIIDELRSRPRREEVQLAEQLLITVETEERFSREKLQRLYELYKEKSISLEELEEVRKEHAIASDRMQEKRANLELVKSGASPEQIAAAEAKLQSYQEEQDYNLKKIEQSVFYMPFDGKIVTRHLKQKIGSYLNRGEKLAIVENTNQVYAEIEVPESDIGFVAESAHVRARSPAYFNEDISGTVTAIDQNVTEERFGRVVRVVTLLDNKDGRLKSGMTGYAKVSSNPLPLWKVLTLSLARFVNVEAWSWLP